MRQIKFRGKTIPYGKWVYGYLTSEPGKNSPVYFIESPQTGESYRVDPDTVGQFTGLTCSTGEIYEGDVLKYKNSYFLTVVFHAGSFGYIKPDTEDEFHSFDENLDWSFWYDSQDDRFEVTGNIYK